MDEKKINQKIEDLEFEILEVKLYGIGLVGLLLIFFIDFIRSSIFRS